MDFRRVAEESTLTGWKFLGSVAILMLAAGHVFAADSRSSLVASPIDVDRASFRDFVDQGGFYLGLGAGQARNRFDVYSDQYTDPAYKFFFGYAPTNYFGAELSFLKIDIEHGQNVNFISLRGTAYIGSAVGILPLTENFQLMAKIGYANFGTTATTTEGNTHANNGDWAYGVMAVVNLGKRFAVRAEYESIGVSRGIFDVGTLSAVFKF